ncbi:hypothetical protein DSO57_1018485 [Entomophthora muscae]|uniref:Uncharacterized protein n=1 Tax=Entomophthora muscae TaxID=34485 RepID=A0ACC2TRS8_9FUNG|nr:hypothetical protein DSO57_1018485 [Entomophthora muscae]
MSSRPLRSFEFRSARNIHPDHERLLKALSEPVLKWKRDVDFPINNREFKIPKWSKTDKRASFNDIIPPPLSKEPSSVKVEIETKVDHELKEAISKDSETNNFDDSMEVDNGITGSYETKEHLATSSEVEGFDDSMEDVYQDLSAQNSASSVKVDVSSGANQKISEPNNTFQEQSLVNSQPTCEVQAPQVDMISNEVVKAFVGVEEVTFTSENNYQLAASQIQDSKVAMDEPNMKSSVDLTKEANEYTELLVSDDDCQIISDTTEQSFSLPMQNIQVISSSEVNIMHASSEMCMDESVPTVSVNEKLETKAVTSSVAIPEDSQQAITEIPVPITIPLEHSQIPEDISVFVAEPKGNGQTTKEISASAITFLDQEPISNVMSVPDPDPILLDHRQTQGLSTSIAVPIGKEQSLEAISDTVSDYHKAQSSKVEPISVSVQDKILPSADNSGLVNPECKYPAAVEPAIVDDIPICSDQSTMNTSGNNSISEASASLPISGVSSSSSQQVLVQDTVATKAAALIESKKVVDPSVPKEASSITNAPQNLE